MKLAEVPVKIKKSTKIEEYFFFVSEKKIAAKFQRKCLINCLK